MSGVCRTAALRLLEPMGGRPCSASFLSAQNKVVVFGSSSFSFEFLGFPLLVASPVLVMTLAAAWAEEEEGEEVIGSTSRWLAVSEKSRTEVGRMDGAAICVAKPCRKQRAIGRAS